MNRRTFVQMAAAAPLARAAARSAGDRPNILLLMADQHRWDCVGAAGNAAIRTPNLDRLAAEGVQFTRAYSSTPTCTPARAALLTGMSPWSHGMLGYGRVAERYAVEMPRLLRHAGYFTTGIGKMHWTPQRALHGFHQTLLDESGRVESTDFRSDYRSWFWSQAPLADPDATGIDWNGYDAAPFALPEHLHPTEWIGSTAVQFLRDYRRPEPFFLKVSFERPHSPYDPPRRWMDRYAGPLPPAASSPWSERYRTRSGNRPDIWHGDLGSAAVQRARRGYYGSVSFVDEHIGRILETLDRWGWLANTLVLYLSDHGDMLGDHNLWRKSYAYEGSSHIPLIVHWSTGLGREARGRRVAAPVEVRDVLPTFAEAAGAKLPAVVEGVSLLSLAGNPDASARRWIDLEHDVCYDASNHWTALTDGRAKYIFHCFDGREQFFDLALDPNETRDMAGDASRSAEVATWRGRMIEHLAPRGEPWVVGGRLGLRPRSMPYSPNYPR